MVRTCCVVGCSSTANTPSHKFPSCTVRREQWIKTLNLENIKNEEILKLRVCHKHFLASDYTCNPKIRLLKNTAIPKLINQDHNQRLEVKVHHHEELILKNMELISQQQNNERLIKQDIEELREELYTHIQRAFCARPNLKKVTRQKLLTLRARRLYKKAIYLRRTNRHLRRRLLKMSENSQKSKAENRDRKEKSSSFCQ